MNKRQVTPEDMPQKPAKRFLVRFGRVCIYGTLGLTIAILLSFSAAALYLYQNQDSLSKTIAEEINDRTGIETSFATVGVTLLPIPALALSDVVLQHNQAKLSIAYAEASPSVWSLVRGKFALGRISLLRPRIAGSIATKPSTEPKPIKQVTETTNENMLDMLHNILNDAALPQALWGCDVNIMHGGVDLTYDNTKIFVDDIHAKLDISFGGVLDASIDLVTSQISENNENIATVDALSLSLSGLSTPDKISAIKLNFNTRLHLANALQDANIALNLTLLPKNVPGNLEEGELPHLMHDVKGSWNIATKLIWHGVPIITHTTGSLDGDFETSLNLSKVTAQLGEDRLMLNANIENILTKTPYIHGNIELEHLNLTRWFGFARHLPPGLQQTLQDITDGQLSFKITEKGLYVEHVEASAGCTRFKGTGGVASWDNMIIKLDVAAPDLSLVKAFPETEGVEAFAPTFEHEPLTPVPGSPAAEAMTGPTVGYDISLSVDKLTTWGLTVGGVDFNCIPSDQNEKANPKNHPNAVILNFDVDKIYNGKAKAKVILFRTEEKQSGYDITAVLRNVRSEDPLTILAGREIFGGRLSLDTSFIAYGKNLGEFLISKVGELTMSTEDGFFTSKSKERTTFDSFKVAGKFTSTPLTKKMIRNMPEVLRYTGLWKTDLQRPDMHIASNLNGVLTLVGRNYTDIVLEDIPGQVQMTLNSDLIGLKQDILADADGKYSFDSVKSTFSVADANIVIPNFANTTLMGKMNLNYADKLQWEMYLKGGTDKFSVLAEKLSSDTKSPIVASAPQTLKMQAKLSNKNQEFHISDLQLTLDKMNISGNIHKITAEKPLWDVNLKINLLDLDKIFPPKKSKQANSALKAATAKPTDPKAWSLNWLKENNAKGNIHIDVLRWHKTTTTNVRIPLKMQDSTLTLSPIKGTFYGGDTKVDFVGKAVGNALHIQGGVNIEKANMLALSHDLELGTAIGGLGSVWLSAQGALTNSETILPLIDGTWRLKIVEGFFQTREKNGTLSGERTIIDDLQDSGPISNGILYSKNLMINGPTLMLTGSGNVDLINDTLDMNLSVTTSGFEDIPVRYYGSLDDPQQDIHTGSVILGAITNLGTGIFDILGGAFEGLFSLFK